MNSLQRFLDLYTRLNNGNLALLPQVYSADIHFCDPAHEIFGIEELTRYFAALYRNVGMIEFTFERHRQIDNEAYVQWLMRFSHPRLAGGQPISVPGISALHFNESGLVDTHRDYFDLGALLYEHLPLLGRIITTIKRRMGT